MPVPIAELFVSVSADVSSAVSGLQNLDRQLNSSTTAFQAARPAALAFTAAGTAVGLGFAKSLQTAASFDQAMSGVNAQLSPDELQQFGGALDTLALQLGQQTTFTARQAAAGIEEMLKAGISAQDVLGGAGQAALDLASATGVSVAEAGTLAAKAMTAFGLSARDLPGVVNTLAGVSVTTAADMTALGQGLSDVGSVAAGFGASFEDTAVVLGVFNQAGLSSQTAGTALKVMLERLQPSTKKNVAEFQKLGLITAEGNNVFFDGQGRIKSYASVAGSLRNALGGMTDAQRQATLTQLFGTQAVQAANILYLQGAAGIDKYAAAARGINAATVASTRRNNLTGDIEQLTGAMEIAQITIGRLFTPAARNAVQQVTKLVQVFNQLSPATQRNLVFLTGIAGAVLFLAGSFVLLAPFIAAAPVAFAAMATSLAALAPVFGLVGLATAALVVAWRRDLGGVQEIVRNAFQNLPGLIDQTKAKVDELSASFTAGLTQSMRGTQTFIDTKLEPAVANLRDRFDELGQKLDPLQGKLAGVNTTLGGMGGQLAAASASGPAAAAGLAPFSGGLNGLAFNLGLAAPALSIFGVGLRVLSPILGLLPPPLLVVAGTLAVAGVAFKLAYDNIQPFREAVDGLLARLPSMADSLGNAFAPLAALAGEQGPAVIAFFQEFSTKVIDQLGRQKDSLQPFGDALSNLFNSLINLLGALGSTGSQVLSQLFNDVLIPGFQTLQTILAPLSPLLQPILDFIIAIARNITIGQALQPITDFFNALSNAFNTIADFLRNNPLQSGVVEQAFRLLPGAGSFNAAGTAGQSQASVNAQLAANGTATAPQGPLVAIGQLLISSEAEANAFIARMAGAIADAAGRVAVPPDNSSHPSLLPSVT
jgi:TP901 family phage tail tape measure protein